MFLPDPSTANPEKGDSNGVQGIEKRLLIFCRLSKLVFQFLNRQFVSLGAVYFTTRAGRSPSPPRRWQEWFAPCVVYNTTPPETASAAAWFRDLQGLWGPSPPVTGSSGAGGRQTAPWLGVVLAASGKRAIPQKPRGSATPLTNAMAIPGKDQPQGFGRGRE